MGAEASAAVNPATMQRCASTSSKVAGARVAVMFQRRLVKLEEAERLFESPRHENSCALLAAARDPDPDDRPNWSLAAVADAAR